MTTPSCSYEDLRPDRCRPVQVLVDGRWLDAELQAYRRDKDGWKGWVRWREAVGAQRIGWFGEDQLRRV